MLPAENAIPKQSKNIVKLRILSNSFAQKIMNTQRVENTVNEVVSVSVLAFLYLKAGGKILSSLMAAITRGLLISKIFT
jgi:hypothetical protein